MRTSRTRLAFAGVAVSVALLGAACSSGSDTASEDTATTLASGSNASEPTGPGCASVPADGSGSFAGMAEDPAATAASNNPLLSTLVTAVTAADLGDTLNGPGPFTIFAPANSAFEKIPADTLKGVLADKAALTDILTYHVVPGEMSSADLIEAGSATTVQGTDVTIEEAGDSFTVNGAEVLCADVPTANATVFIIGDVMMPDAATNASTGPTGPACDAVPADGAGSFAGMAEDPAATAASNNPLLSTLVTAVTAAGLGDTLNGPGPFTIFAPVNDAFAKIPADTLNSVLADQAALTDILTYHVIAGEMTSAELIAAGMVPTVEGGEVTIAAAGESFTVNGANVLCADVPTANATVFLIDSVLMPS